MSDFAAVRPEFLHIRAPQFTLGDYVQWVIDFGDESIAYYGIIQCISWSKDIENESGCWDYIVRQLKIFYKGQYRDSKDYDQVLESDLSPWIGDGIDTKIDSSIDTGIVPPTTNKASNASLL